MSMMWQKLMNSAASFPAVASITTSEETTASTSTTVDMPATVSSGDLLILLMGADGVAGSWSSAASGWNELADGSSQTVWYKIADGTEGGTAVTFTSAGSCRVAVQTWRITDWHGTTPPEIAQTNTTVGTTTIDPPSLTPSWGSAKTLWIAAAIMERSDRTISSWPANYTDNQTVFCNSGGGNRGGTFAASRELEASSEDPGNIVISGNSNENMAVTIAVRPA